MALTDSDKLRSSNDKKFKGHTEDKTIKVASGKKFINAGIQGVAKTFEFSLVRKAISGP